MNTYTPEEKQRILEEHKEVIESMKQDIALMDEKLGRNHSACQKMRTVVETFESFTAEEILALESIELNNQL